MVDESRNRNIDDDIGNKKGDDLSSRIEHGSDFGKGQNDQTQPNYQGNRSDKPYEQGTDNDMNRDVNRDMNNDMDKNKPGYGNEKKGDYNRNE